ncbi:DUF2933 domain-containing protein [candidate division WWE3 bacterium]|jgi:hypothetical protein|uniref:DUF2933 domain-containing protein n=1 Tax=candidate division WWE3 bacterium TaxID=2053526 RepID=A0A3A4ZA98_UNCKA|nr:MAG: DUF2933 domain-containing protein [candidate division WWE3 bacterium]
MKKLLTSWHLWVVAIVLGVLIIFRQTINASLVLPLVLVLICPFMMMFMMKDHKH